MFARAKTSLRCHAPLHSVVTARHMTVSMEAGVAQGDAEQCPYGRPDDRKWATVVLRDVEWGHMDAFQHVNNLIYLRWFENARIDSSMRLWSFGSDSGSGKSEGNTGPILASTSINFLAAVEFPDQVLTQCRVSHVGGKSIKQQYEVWSRRQQKVVASGEAVIVFFDYNNNKAIEWPQGVRKAVLELDGEVEGVL